MKRDFLKLQIDISDHKYAKRLAQRFAELSGRLEILTFRSDEECDVLITDKGESCETDSEECILFLEEKDKYLPSKILLLRVLDLYETHHNNSFHLSDESELKVIYFYSPFGGSGATSVSLTFARLLLMMNYRTLFASVDRNENYLCYSFADTAPLKNKEQLGYFLEKDEKIIIEEYLTRDKYGLNILPLINKYNCSSVEKLLEKQDKYDYLIIDYGRPYHDMHSAKSFSVFNANDLRNRFGMGIGKPVYNMSPGNRLGEDGLFIQNDPESFRATLKGIDISMNGVFCQGISNILKRCLHEWDW